MSDSVINKIMEPVDDHIAELSRSTKSGLARLFLSLPKEKQMAFESRCYARGNRVVVRCKSHVLNDASCLSKEIS